MHILDMSSFKMAFKYLILVVLAIEVVNAGVIKATPPAIDFNELLTVIKILGWTSSGLHDELNSTNTEAIRKAHENATMWTEGSVLMFKNLEDFYAETAPWALICFKPVPDELAVMNEDLVVNVERCLWDTEVVTKVLLEESVLHEQGAIDLKESLIASWVDCKQDADCETIVFKQAKQDMAVFSSKVRKFIRTIEVYIDDDFMDLTSCVRTYVNTDFFDNIRTALYRIEECVEENEPVKQ